MLTLEVGPAFFTTAIRTEEEVDNNLLELQSADMMERHGTVTRKLAQTTSTTCKKLLYTSLLP